MNERQILIRCVLCTSSALSVYMLVSEGGREVERRIEGEEKWTKLYLNVLEPSLS